MGSLTRSERTERCLTLVGHSASAGRRQQHSRRLQDRELVLACTSSTTARDLRAWQLPCRPRRQPSAKVHRRDVYWTRWGRFKWPGGVSVPTEIEHEARVEWRAGL